jgi:hypothetical protein
MSTEKAEALFDQLKREISLVSTAPDGSLRHRQDLRVVMLEVLRADDADKVKAIHERAVAYYDLRLLLSAQRRSIIAFN